MPKLFRGSSQPQDPRPKATMGVWFMALLMMGPAVPMVLVTQQIVFPMAVMATAGLSTACVWLFGGRGIKRNAQDAQELRQSREEIAALKESVQDLQQRLECLETISRYERLRDQAALDADAMSYGMADTSMSAPPMSAPQPTARRSVRNDRSAVSL
jgi:hypothetical protein